MLKGKKWVASRPDGWSSTPLRCQAQRDVEREPSVALAEMELTSQTETVSGVALFEVGIQPVGGLEVCHPQGAAVALEAVTQGVQRAVGIHLLAQVGQDLGGGVFAVQDLKSGPFFWLGPLDETVTTWGKMARLGSNPLLSGT